MDPCHVIFVATNGGCTRVHKEAAALTDRGWRVDLLSDRDAAGWGVYGQLYGEQHIAARDRWPELLAASPAGLVHMHNEPDDMMRDVLEGIGRRPIVYDVHDLALFKRGLTVDAELAFAACDAVVHVSPEVRDAARAVFPHPQARRVLVLENYPLRRVAELYRPPQRGRCVVYVGGMSPRLSGGYWRHRYWKDVDAAFAAADVAVSWYSRTSDHCGVREPRPWHPYGALLGEMTRHSWGLVGSEVKRALQSMASPNKAWEYLALGLPLLALNQERMRRELGGRAGVYAGTVEELIAGMRSARWQQLHEEALDLRRFMEDQIEGLERLYGELLRSRTRRRDR